MGITANLSRLVRDPALLGEYAGWLMSSAVTRGKPTRTMLGGLKIGNFTNFSEYHSVPRFINEDERGFFEKTTFGEGPIVDVGANVGLVSLLLARRFPETTIHAFEPNPSTFEALQANIARNAASNVVCNQSAVSDVDGTVLFHNDPIARGTASISLGVGTFSTEVPSITLDNYVASRGIDRIGLLKIDVEGFETLVLRGATKVLTEIRPAAIYFEVCPILTERSGFAVTKPAEMLLDAGYDLFRLADGGVLEPAKLEEIAGVSLENWLAKAR